MTKQRIYLDYAAAAPALPVVRRVAVKASKIFGNPSSIHQEGILAAHALREARADVAYVLGAQSNEIVFVGSGTESDNLAVMGVFKHARLSKEFIGRSVHIITTAIEHPAVLESCRHIEAMGGSVTYLSVGTDGRIDLKELRAAFTHDTVLVSIAYANNEIGVIQPVREIAKEIRHFRKELGDEKGPSVYPLFHSDACQAVAYESITVAQLGVDLLSFNSSKIGGPRGVAALYVKRGTPIDTMLYGGGQEGGLRSGTESLPAIIGFARALAEVNRIKDSESTRVRRLRDYFTDQLQKEFPECRINGSMEFRLPNNVHVSFKNFTSELLVLELDAKGIAASAGSACSSAKETGSAVLAALYGASDQKEWGSIRFSMGHETKKSEINAALSALALIFKKYTDIKK